MGNSCDGADVIIRKINVRLNEYLEPLSSPFE